MFNNPLRFNDPSGHDGQDHTCYDPGDPSCSEDNIIPIPTLDLKAYGKPTPTPGPSIGPANKPDTEPPQPMAAKPAQSSSDNKPVDPTELANGVDNASTIREIVKGAWEISKGGVPIPNPILGGFQGAYIQGIKDDAFPNMSSDEKFARGMVSGVEFSINGTLSGGAGVTFALAGLAACGPGAPACAVVLGSIGFVGGYYVTNSLWTSAKDSFNDEYAFPTIENYFVP